MNIDFTGPVYPVDRYAQSAFIEILNIIQLSENVTELSVKLVNHNYNPRYRTLSGYFKWSYENHSFTIWQRTLYKSDTCFANPVFNILYSSFDENSVKQVAVCN